LPDSGGGARDAGVAAAGVGLCRDHVYERAESHAVLDSGAHGGCGELSPSGARVLFFSVSVGGFDVADGAAAAHGASGFSVANGLLSDHVGKSTRGFASQTVKFRPCYHRGRNGRDGYAGRL